MHAVAGAVGLICTGLFADSRVAYNDGFLMIPGATPAADRSDGAGGWVNHHYIQLGYQLAWIWSVATTPPRS